MTGAQYLESLQDGREVYIYGQRVPNVTTHPAFRNAARSIARLYDALHDPAQKDTLLGTDRSGILTMGRTPDYKASFMATLGAAPRLLRALHRERIPLVPGVRHEGPVPEPRHRQPAGGPPQAGARGGRRLRARGAGDRRRHHRQRRGRPRAGRNQASRRPRPTSRSIRRPAGPSPRRARLRPAPPGQEDGGSAPRAT